MITRYALFQGNILTGKAQEFRAAVIDELLPTWQAYPGATAVRVAFEVERDAGAASVPLVLAVDFPTRAALELALGSQERIASRAATQRVLPGLFDGEILHYITENLSFPVG